MNFMQKIKNIITSNDNQVKIEFENALKQCVNDEMNDAYNDSYINSNYKQLSYFTATFHEKGYYKTTIKHWNTVTKDQFLLYLAQIVNDKHLFYLKGIKSERIKFHTAQNLISVLLKSKLQLSEATIIALFECVRTVKNKNPHQNYIVWWPLPAIIKQIGYTYDGQSIPTHIISILHEILTWKPETTMNQYKSIIKVQENIKQILHSEDNNGIPTSPTYFVGEDEFTAIGNKILLEINDEKLPLWYQLMLLSQKGNTAKPTKKFLNEAKTIIDQIGQEDFHCISQQWFNAIIQLKEITITKTNIFGGNTYNYNEIQFLSNINSDMLKGFVWMASLYPEHNAIYTITLLAERCFKKIPSKGPAASGLGNACLYTLSAIGLEGIAQLSRLKLKIKLNNTITLIDKYLSAAAQQLGVSNDAIEDLAVEHFHLSQYEVSHTFGTVKGTITLSGIGKTEVKWYKPNGTAQKTVPQVVKDEYASALKTFKLLQKQIEQATVIQKERLDRMLRNNREMDVDYFKKHYLAHGLLSFVIQKVIFVCSNDTDTQLVIYLGKQLYALNNTTIDIDQYKTIRLWHPATSDTETVKQWRAYLMGYQLQQPFKQAYREIYLLTDAEIHTHTYSNRMASHILKQHQYATLAKGRNWHTRLLGAWDGGDSDTARLMLPEYKLYAELWVDSLIQDEQFNDSGIWNYVITDQIRFCNIDTHEIVPLAHIPIIVFSEVMRDVDLFVGVASIGNDPAWSDSGHLPNHLNYWQNYSFGNLSEIAKNRKDILQNLLPRLKIAPVAHIEDKFLIIKGKIRTYKIHIGSTNILMEPNDQYLCIVPDRSKSNSQQNVFLPFEGDSGLSIIISKALLLANDDQITDPTITSQIKRL